MRVLLTTWGRVGTSTAGGIGRAVAGTRRRGAGVRAAGLRGAAHGVSPDEIDESHKRGVCTVTLIHDVADAPMVAGMVPGGGDPSKGGGGWPWALSDLKSLLETGKRMPV